MNRDVTILLVDDDDIDVEVILRTLKSARIVNPVVRARDGQEALEFLREADKVPRPRVVLLDINMPRMNGHEFLAKMRADPELSREVVFVLTTSDDDDDIDNAYQHHVAGYVVKERAGEGFREVVAMLGHYWKIVELPDPESSPRR